MVTSRPRRVLFRVDASASIGRAISCVASPWQRSCAAPKDGALVRARRPRASTLLDHVDGQPHSSSRSRARRRPNWPRSAVTVGGEVPPAAIRRQWSSTTTGSGRSGLRRSTLASTHRDRRPGEPTPAVRILVNRNLGVEAARLRGLDRPDNTTCCSAPATASLRPAFRGREPRTAAFADRRATSS